MRHILIVAALLVACRGAPGQETAPELKAEERATLQRIALARARAAAWNEVAGLSIGGDLRVSAWAARDATTDRELRLWVRSLPEARAGRFYSDGICEVDVRIEPAALAAQLVALRESTARRDSAGPDSAAIHAAARGWPIIWGTGRARFSERSSAEKPVGWEDVSFEGMELARRAASADAIFALVDQAGRLKVTPAQRLREFLDSELGLRDAVRAEVEKAARIEVTLAPDQVALAQASLPINDLIRILTSVHQTRYQGDEFRAADFREMALIANVAVVNATGLAPPPADSLLRSQYTPIELDAPPWVNTSLRVIGRYVPGDEGASKASHVELARLDGLNQARVQIEALVVQSPVTLEQFLGIAPTIKDDVVLFLSSARAVLPPRQTPDGGLEVQLELPLARLWEIVARGLPVVEVEAPIPSTQPSSAAASQPSVEVVPAGEGLPAGAPGPNPPSAASAPTPASQPVAASQP